MAQRIPQGTVSCSMADISTAHITAEDNRLLGELCADQVERSQTACHAWREAEFSAGYAVPVNGGWLLRILEDGAKADDQEAREAGFSEAFINLLAFWRSRNVGWVRIDQDADATQSLPVFDW